MSTSAEKDWWNFTRKKLNSHFRSNTSWPNHQICIRCCEDEEQHLGSSLMYFICCQSYQGHGRESLLRLARVADVLALTNGARGSRSVTLVVVCLFGGRLPFGSHLCSHQRTNIRRQTKFGANRNRTLFIALYPFLGKLKLPTLSSVPDKLSMNRFYDKTLFSDHFPFRTVE